MKIDRSTDFWRELFFEAWKQQLSREGSEVVIASAALAQRAAALADDAAREALELSKPPVCSQCAGVGCAGCQFTGREVLAPDPKVPSP